MKKKCSIISLLLVFAICFSSVAYASSADDENFYTDVQAEYEENCAFLNALGIFPDDLTRNIFSNEISEKYAYGYALELMAIDHNHHTLIADLAKNAGFINAVAVYKADGKITPTDAARIFVSVLGYTAQSQVKGGYLAYAAKLGIFDGVEFDNKKYVTYADFYKMIVNSLDIEVSEVTKIKDGSITYSTANDETILSVYFDIDTIEGVVAENDLSTFYLPTNNGKGALVIDGVKYFYDDDHASDLLGHNIRAYVRSNENNKVIYAKPYESYSLTITDSEFDNYKGNAITYYLKDSNKSKTARLVSKPIVLYNDVAYPNYTAADIKNFSGELVLIDNNDNGVYDVVKIYDYTYGFVDTVNVFDNGIRFSKPAGTYLSLENYDDEQVVLYNGNGESVVFGYILNDDFLSIAESKTKHKCTIIINRDTVEGTVTEKDDDLITVDNVDYEFTSFVEADINKLAVGTPYKFYLDNSGRIVGFDKGSVSDTDYAFIMAVASSGALNAKCRVKLIDTKGEIRELDFADKVIVDGKSVKHGAVIPTITADDGSVRQLVKYRTNSDGKVVFVDTARTNANDGNDTLKLDTYTSFKAQYRDKNGVGLFGGKVITNKNTTFFTVPKVQSSDPTFVFDDYEYAVSNSFANDNARRIFSKSGDYIAFADVDDHSTCDVVVYYKNTPVVPSDKTIGNSFSLMEPGNGRQPVMVREIRHTVDENGEKAYKVIFEKDQFAGGILSNAHGAFYAANYLSVIIPERDENILWKKVYDADLNVTDGHKMMQAGDIVQFDIDPISKRVSGSAVVYDVSLTPLENAKILHKGSHDGYDRGVGFSVSVVNWVDNDAYMSLYMTYSDELDNIDTSDGAENIIAGSLRGAVYDTEKKEVYQMDFRNIRDINTYPDSYDYVLVANYYGEIYGTFVIH